MIDITKRNCELYEDTYESGLWVVSLHWNEVWQITYEEYIYFFFYFSMVTWHSATGVHQSPEHLWYLFFCVLHVKYHMWHVITDDTLWTSDKWTDIWKVLDLSDMSQVSCDHKMWQEAGEKWHMKKRKKCNIRDLTKKIIGKMKHLTSQVWRLLYVKCHIPSDLLFPYLPRKMNSQHFTWTNIYY